MTTFELIKKLAREQGMTLAQLNERSGLGKNSIYHWSTKTPSTDSLSKVADVLHVSVDYLLGNTDDPNPPKASGEKPMSKNQKLIAYSIDPDVSDEEREAIIEMVKQAMKFRKRL